MPTFASDSNGNKAVSVAPASLGKHLAIGLETPSDVHFLYINTIMEAKNKIIKKTDLEGWNRNTELAVDLKTILRSDRRMKTGKEYPGVLRRDSEADIDEFRCRDAHFTFIETVRRTAEKRNPHVFVGKHITVTRRDDGSLRLNFKPLPDEQDLNLDRYALGVYNEICIALAGLIEEV